MGASRQHRVIGSRLLRVVLYGLRNNKKKGRQWTESERGEQRTKQSPSVRESPQLCVAVRSSVVRAVPLLPRLAAQAGSVAATQ